MTNNQLPDSIPTGARAPLQHLADLLLPRVSHAHAVTNLLSAISHREMCLSLDGPNQSEVLRDAELKVVAAATNLLLRAQMHSLSKADMPLDNFMSPITQDMLNSLVLSQDEWASALICRAAVIQYGTALTARSLKDLVWLALDKMIETLRWRCLADSMHLRSATKFADKTPNPLIMPCIELAFSPLKDVHASWVSTLQGISWFSPQQNNSTPTVIPLKKEKKTQKKADAETPKPKSKGRELRQVGGASHV